VMVMRVVASNGDCEEEGNGDDDSDKGGGQATAMATYG
jgi:hypothetical protein